VTIKTDQAPTSTNNSSVNSSETAQSINAIAISAISVGAVVLIAVGIFVGRAMKGKMAGYSSSKDNMIETAAIGGHLSTPSVFYSMNDYVNKSSYVADSGAPVQSIDGLGVSPDAPRDTYGRWIWNRLVNK